MNGTWEFEFKLSKSFLLHFNFLLLLLPTWVAVTVTWETPTDGGGLVISAIFSILATFLLCLASAWCGLFEPGFEPCALLPAVAFACACPRFKSYNFLTPCTPSWSPFACGMSAYAGQVWRSECGDSPTTSPGTPFIQPWFLVHWQTRCGCMNQRPDCYVVKWSLATEPSARRSHTFIIHSLASPLYTCCCWTLQLDNSSIILQVSAHISPNTEASTGIQVKSR
ncbi:hypothetical protein B0H11DRAFT_406847 [Mycena galericulata]|nr:hypothetical protein B0H11DRAFT_406847 [Mycena galericulata]